MTADMKITAIAPWFGSKRTLAKTIIEELGPHRSYWEPFCGSCSVLLAKPPSSQEHAVISDELTVIDPQTRKLIEARMRDEYFSQNWRRGLRYVRTSDLCCGRVPPREGYQAPWRANVKWFCSPGELQKILAGKYGGNADGRTEEEEEQDWARAGAEQEADQ